MSRKKTVFIKVPQASVGDEGGQIINYVGSSPVKRASIQPYSSELARKEYGLEIKVTALMFSNPNPLLKADNMIYVSETEKYLITGVAPWINHYECFLEEYHG